MSTLIIIALIAAGLAGAYFFIPGVKGAVNKLFGK